MSATASPRTVDQMCAVETMPKVSAPFPLAEVEVEVLRAEQSCSAAPTLASKMPSTGFIFLLLLLSEEGEEEEEEGEEVANSERRRATSGCGL